MQLVPVKIGLNPGLESARFKPELERVKINHELENGNLDPGMESMNLGLEFETKNAKLGDKLEFSNGNMESCERWNAEKELGSLTKLEKS
jgi:hypothetical protein